MARRLLSLIFIFSVSFLSHSSAISLNYSDALTKSILFFEGQRSGKLPPDQRVKWRKDSALNDGASAGVDLTGGYYDAGDNVKFGFPMAFTTTLLAWSIIDFGRGMRNELGNALNALKWGTDYLLKTTAQDGIIYVQVGDPIADHNCWERPEDMDTIRTVYKVDQNNPGSDIAGETAAALAAASIVFRKRDPSYSRLLLDRAIKVFDFADKYRGLTSSSANYAVCPYYCSYSYEDELLWGAAWLKKATGMRKYRKYILQNQYILKAGDAFNEFGWDNKHAGINVLLSKENLMGKVPEFNLFRNNAEQFICSILPGSPNPIVNYSPGGLMFKPGGSNMQHPTTLSFIVLAYSNYLSHSKHVVSCGTTSASSLTLKQLAKRQVDYILGDNPMSMSYMVGFGPRYPQKIHHRASSLPSLDVHPARLACNDGAFYFNSPDPNLNPLVGAVVGGPNISDLYLDERGLFVETEPTTYINAPLVGLLAYFSSHA